MELKVRLANSCDSNLAYIWVDEANLDTVYGQIEVLYGLGKSDFVLSSKNGIKLTSKSVLNDGDIVQLNPTVLGGKGGFGSLLRAFGKQITKSTNKDACRDLTGRRMRNVKNEKKLKEYLANQSEILKKKEEDKKARQERRKKKKEKLESTHHLFVDPKYDEAKQKIADDLDQAIATAIKNKKLKNKNNTDSSSSENESSSKSDENSSSNGDSEKDEIQPSSSKSKEEKNNEIVEKNKKEEKKPNETKFKGWMGVDDLDVSSSDDDDDDDEEPTKKIKKN